MKRALLTGIAVSLIFLSCEKESSGLKIKGEPLDSMAVILETSDPIESSTLQTCYLQATGTDSVFVSLEDNLGTIIGKMRYKNADKDSSTGELIGSQNGDTLKLNYTFQAEGKTSGREIYFLKKGENIIEGIGEQLTEGMHSTYTNTAQLKYEGNTLKQIDCTEFAQKFKMK